MALVLLPAACSTVGAPQADAATSPSTGAPSVTSAAAGTVRSTVAAVGTVLVAWDVDDLDQDWNSSGATSITLDGDVISVEGRGATVDGSTVTVTSSGMYVISGTLDGGWIRVDTDDKKTVRLVLNGADITCSTSAPIYVVNAEKTVITLAAGTVNRVADGARYLFEDPESGEPNAAIFSHDDLTINGGGSLAVEANYDNGIQSKDDLKIAGGVITVDAVNDGIKGRDSVAVRDGSITVTAGGDGIQASNDEDAEKGFVFIEGGKISISAGMDGIQAETSLLVSGGTIAITSGGGSAEASQHVDSFPAGPGMQRPVESAGTDTADSAKGLKAGVDLIVTGGSISIDSSDDAVHSNGSISISGGQMTLATGDDGMHADASVHIAGGVIGVTASYEGIESAVITIDDGTIHIVSSDDGVNVSAGNDGSGMMGIRPGQDSFASSADTYLEINGGYLAVDALGDGLDVNGAVTMTGGVVIVHGPTSNWNGALDYMRGFVMTGGLLVAAGSSGMAQAPDTSSSQRSVIVDFAAAQAAGTLFRIETAGGESVLTFLPSKAYQSVVFGSPELRDGETYVIYTGGSSTGTAVDGLYSGGTYSGGTRYAEFTVSGPLTAVGSARPGQMGGPGIGPGGGRRMPQ